MRADDAVKREALRAVLDVTDGDCALVVAMDEDGSGFCSLFASPATDMPRLAMILRQKAQELDGIAANGQEGYPK